MSKACDTCQDAPAVIRGQCRACDVYERRHGRRRSPEKLAELEQRRVKRAIEAFERAELRRIVRDVAGGSL